VTWKSLPKSQQPSRFEPGLLKTTWKFTSGTWLAVTFAQVAMLGDKIILSALLPLHLFGLYSLAVTVTGTIQRLAPPFTNSYFPYFVRLMEQDRQDVLIRAYRQASESASVVFLAAGLSLVVYAGAFAQLLAADATSAATLALLLALLAAANTLNVEMALPFSLLFARGITWIALRINAALCVLYLAALVGLVPRYGVAAAAALWLAANAVMLPVLIIMAHRTILTGQAWPWLLRAILLPGCGAAAVLMAGAAMMPELSRLPMLIWIGFNAALALAAALLAAPATREIVARIVFRRSAA
jgi:O-antigen/teichoic acid export membrane protein